MSHKQFAANQSKTKPMLTALSIALMAITHTAMAQEGVSTTGKLESVVVSANKRVEKLESVPMAISVLSEAVIQRANIREMEDVIALTPALSVASGTTAANNTIFMRGIGTLSNGIGVESDVSVIIDDIPMAAQFQSFRDLADVARIEILKGPQSTLFGKSSVAGAVNIVTKPITGPMIFRASGYLTNDHETRVSASVGGKVNDEFGVRVAASRSNFDGLLHNLTTNENVGGSSGKTLMAKLSWHPTSAIDVDLTPYYNDQKNGKGVTAINGFNLTSGSLAAGNLTSTPVGIANAYLGGSPLLPATVTLAGINPNDPKNINVRRDFPTGINSTDNGTGVKVSYTLPNDAVLMSITSYNRYKANDYRDQDFVDVPTIAKAGSTALTIGGNQFGTYDIRAKSEEIRLVSPDNSDFRYVAGLWWARNEIDRRFTRGYCLAPTVCTATSPTSPTNYVTSVYNVNKSIFGQASWDFMPTYTLLAGMRLNSEESGFDYKRNFYTNQIDDASFVPGPVGIDQFSNVGNVDKAITGKLSLQKQINKEVMVYAMAATGYKGIAYDLTSGLKTSSAFPVAPETSKSFEIGLKANLFDNKMTLAVAAFNSKFAHYQQQATFTLPNDPIFYNQLTSIPMIGTRGAEVDANMLVAAGLTLNASLAYTLPTIEDWKSGICYTDLTNVAVGTTKLASNGSLAGFNNKCFPALPGATTGFQDLSGGIFPNTPKIKVNIGGNYDFGIPSMPFAAFVNANMRYQSEYNTNINNDPNLVNKGYTITDLGFGVRDNSDKYVISFRINNLFDRFYVPNFNLGGPSYRNGPTTSSQLIAVNSWVPARDSFRYFSVKLDVKF